MTTPDPPVTKAVPTCYRHPDRETRISCGRCGKPLCPDCVMHGPVGTRCRECLLPQGKGTGGTLDRSQVKKAVNIAAVLAAVWIIIIAVATILTGLLSLSIIQQGEITRELLPLFIKISVWAPNFLLCGVAGGTIGWLIWRISQRTWNSHTIRAALLLAIAVPLMATIIITVALGMVAHGYGFVTPLYILRALASIGISMFMAWLLVTNNM